MAKKNNSKYGEMSLDELEALSNKMDGERLAIRDEMRVVRREIDARLAQQSAADKLARLNDAERLALLQMIEEAGGIESLAAFGDLDSGEADNS